MMIFRLFLLMKICFPKQECLKGYINFLLHVYDAFGGFFIMNSMFMFIFMCLSTIGVIAFIITFIIETIKMISFILDGIFNSFGRVSSIQYELKSIVLSMVFSAISAGILFLFPLSTLIPDYVLLILRLIVGLNFWAALLRITIAYCRS